MAVLPRFSDAKENTRAFERTHEPLMPVALWGALNMLQPAAGSPSETPLPSSYDGSGIQLYNAVIC